MHELYFLLLQVTQFVMPPVTHVTTASPKARLYLLNSVHLSFRVLLLDMTRLEANSKT